MVDAKKLSELDALYRPQVGVTPASPQTGGRNLYTMESDYFRNLTPQQQTALVGSAVQPEGMTNAYQPAPMIPLPIAPQAPPVAPATAQPGAVVKPEDVPMLWQPDLDPAKAGLDLARYYKGVR